MAEKDSKKMKKIDKRIKKETRFSNLNDEQKEIIRFGIIVLVIIAFVGIVYGVSKLLIKEEEEKMTMNVTPGAINYDIVSVGTMFNRPYDEYYVIVYDSTKNEAIYYSSLINSYTSKDKSLKVYLCDLDTKFNQEYYVGNDKSNKNAKSIEDLAFGDFSLIKIKNGKITKYLESVEDLKKEWSLED